MANPPNVTERQARYFASLRSSLEASSGRSLDEWVAIAQTCPETGHRARLKWFKERHGLLQNRASLVISEAFSAKASWSEPEALLASQWPDPRAKAIFAVIDAAALAMPDVLRTVRMRYTAWSRKVQFAAARPLHGGRLMLGLAVATESSARLRPRGSESWSERLRSKLAVDAPEDIDAEVLDWLSQAWTKA